MMPLMRAPRKGGLSVLCLGAHSDDIEIGCGGTILKLLKEEPVVRVDWIVFGATGRRKREAEASAVALLEGAARRSVAVRGFRDGYFPYAGAGIKDAFEALKTKVRPDLVFTHHRRDLHQDHRLIAELTWNTFRDHLILEYEVPKYDGDLETPNVYVPLDMATARDKIRHILRSFPSQAGNAWFDREAFLALLRIRGLESNAPSGYAEGFHGRKLTCL
jgi:LmbE family N-acetylglucosaminyl deacetylase